MRGRLLSGRWPVEGLDLHHLAAGLVLADRARATAVGVGGRQGEHPHPERSGGLGADAAVGHRAGGVAAEAGDRAHEARRGRRPDRSRRSPRPRRSPATTAGRRHRSPRRRRGCARPFADRLAQPAPSPGAAARRRRARPGRPRRWGRCRPGARPGAARCPSARARRARPGWRRPAGRRPPTRWQAEALAEQLAHRVLDEADEVVQADRRRRWAAPGRAGEERRRRGAFGHR
jgi:hypothetical protein